ncbi:MAG: PD40 domain-containing protein [Colwellia sp.]|nr:PD40 domain-containing protein [Colwellia sp.]
MEKSIDPKQQEQQKLQIGAWLVDPLALTLQKGEQIVKVQPKIIQLLNYLAKFPDEVLLREDLIANVWPEVSATDDTLNNMIGKLRRVLVADNECQQYIETIPKKGYCLKANVSIATVNHNNQSAKKLTVISLITITSFFLLYYLYFNYFSSPPAAFDFNQNYSVESVTSHQELEIFPTLSPNSKQIAFIRAAKGLQTNKLIIKQLTSGDERELNDIAGLYGNPVWSNDGKQIAYIHMNGSTCTIRIVEVLGGPSHFISECSGELIRTMRKSLLWHHQNNSLIFTKSSINKGVLALYNFDLETKQLTKLSSPPINVIGDANPATSANGKLIAFTRTNNSGVDNIIVLDLTNNKETEYPLKSPTVLGLDWLDDSSIIFVSDDNNRSELMVLNIKNGKEYFTRINGTGLLHPSFNKTSKNLVFADLQSNANIVIKQRIGESEATLVTELPSSKFEREAIFSPNGKIVVYIRLLENGSELWLYDLDKQQHKRLVKPENTLFKHISFSPDNSKIVLMAIKDKTSSIQVYDFNRQHFFKLDTATIEKPLNPTWSTDNKQVLFTSKKEGEWLIWQTSIENTELTLLTEQGGNVVKADEEGKVIYFSRQGQTGLWQLPLSNLSAIPTKLTEKINVPFQSWKFVSGVFYYLKRESIPSTQIVSYEPKSDKVALYFQSNAAFNYFDVHDDLIVTAEIKEFTADIYLIKLK